MAEKKKDVAKVAKKDNTNKNAKQVNPAPQRQAEPKSEKAKRTILVDGCPPTTTKEQLQATFKTAAQIKVLMAHGKCIGRALLTFATAKEAQAVAQRKTADFGDRKLRFTFTGHAETPEERERRLGEERSRRIKLEGLSADLTEDEAEAELREVLPAVEEVRLLFGAQGKFRHGAQVTFSTAAAARKVAAQPLVVRGTKVLVLPAWLLASGEIQPPKKPTPEASAPEAKPSADPVDSKPLKKKKR